MVILRQGSEGWCGKGVREGECVLGGGGGGVRGVLFLNFFFLLHLYTTFVLETCNHITSSGMV